MGRQLESQRARYAQDIEAAVKTYHYLSERWFTHASPTLFNAGTPRPQLSSCFLICMKVRANPFGPVEECRRSTGALRVHAIHACACKFA